MSRNVIAAESVQQGWGPHFHLNGSNTGVCSRKQQVWLCECVHYHAWYRSVFMKHALTCL